MTAPPKPWENRVGIGDILGTAGTGISPNRNVLNSAAPQLTSQPMGSVRTSALPPLPPRPAQLSTTNRPTFGMSPSMYGGYSGYGGGYGGYSSFGSGYGMSSGYGSMYGGYPGSYGYGSYGQPGNMFENRFLQAAEESSRGAFQSIESLVRAFTSVSMMLESTYHAMYSSFRAILGVVDNFSKLRQMFAQFISAITILKMIKSFYQRLLYWLGIVKQNPVSEQIWETAATGETSVPKTSAWPLFTFVGLLFGGPYLISKFFTPSITEPKKWDPKSGTFYKAAYPYEATSESELSFSDNEVLNVAPSEMQLQNNNGWLLAANRQGNIGYIPVTRLAPQRQIITSQLTDTSFNKPNSDSIPTSELAEKNKD